VWAPGYSLYANSKWPQWYPGSDVVDVVAEDTYNATTAQEPFSAVACKIGPRAGKPFAITETGARSNEQLAWLGNVKAACPGLTAFIYFDAKGTSGFDYEMTTPKAMAAFKAIAQ
jgi:beta-mannanase